VKGRRLDFKLLFGKEEWAGMRDALSLSLPTMPHRHEGLSLDGRGRSDGGDH
jgi:hypothetical protein